MFDLNGRIFYRSTYVFIEANGRTSMTIPLEDSGIYYIRLISPGQNLSLPLVWLK